MENVTGNRIKRLRELQNEKQEDLALILGIKRQVVSYYESGTRFPNVDVLIELAKHYNVTTDYLLGLSDVQSTDKDMQFVCDYLHLDEYATYALHFWGNSSLTETINNLLGSLSSFLIFQDFAHHYVTYKSLYSKLILLKTELIESKNIVPDNYKNAEEYYDKYKKMSDELMLIEFKLQKFTKELLNDYVENEKKADNNIKEDFEQYLYQLLDEIQYYSEQD